MEREYILHSDLNCFYASVEMNEDPSLLGRKVAVCGSTEDRHGIVLTASYPAKRCGVKTGMANWQALQACPDLICVPPRYDLYLKYSRTVRAVYRRYADRIEPFGMDENWISIPGGGTLEEDGRRLAEEIRRAVREETGLTVSVGVSFTKVFAKLGSDMKKPDAVTVIPRERFREMVWPLPAGELLYVGRATERKLRRLNIRTIGEIARCDPEILHSLLGVNGIGLWRSANGVDGAPVMPADWEPPVKSVGHSSTLVEDVGSEWEIWRVLYELAQDVGFRLREHGLQARGVSVWVRDRDLESMFWQCPLGAPTRSPLELAQAGFALFRANYPWHKPVRSAGISGIRLERDDRPAQLDLFHDAERQERRRAADGAVDALRTRFGPDVICAASLMDRQLKMARDKCETVVMPGLMYMG